MRKIMFLSLFLGGALILGACVPVQAPTPAPATEAPQSTAVVIERASDVPRITLEEAKAHFDNGTAIFMDARDQYSYDVEHITGAVPRPTVPLSELGDTLPKDQLIITYCT